MAGFDVTSGMEVVLARVVATAAVLGRVVATAAAMGMGSDEVGVMAAGAVKGGVVAWARARKVAAAMEVVATVAVEEEAQGAAEVGDIEGT